MTTKNPGRIRDLLDGTLVGEPPLLDLVPGAVTAAEHGRRRTRMMAGGAAVAVLAVAVGAYGVADHGHAGSTGSGLSSPGGGRSPSPTPKPSPSHPTAPKHAFVAETHKSTFGLTGLFDNPGSPQEQCAKVKAPPRSSDALLTSSRDYCVRALTQVRSLLPHTTVVMQPFINFGQPNWSEPLAKTPDGGTLAGFSQAYQKAFEDPAAVSYDGYSFAFQGPNGNGIASYETTKPGVKSKPEPGGEIPLGDGTSGHFKQSDNGDVSVTGVTADGMWYDLVISGVYQIYGESGGWLSPTFKGDGLDHEVFPDGYVIATPAGTSFRIPNPYTADEVRDLITAKGFGTMVNAIGADPLSLVPARS
jgi:hypothetical protein